MNRLVSLMNRRKKIVIGMIHIKPTPGSPKYRINDSISNIYSDAINQAKCLIDSNIDGLIIENMHDRPYNLAKVQNPITVSILSVISSNIRSLFPSIPIGVQVLSGGNHEALSIAAATDLDFIRCEGFVFGHLGDEGWIESCGSSLLRYRKQIQSDHIWVMADVKKKHSSHAITSDITLLETIKSAEFFLADSVVITGRFTGSAPDICELKKLKDSKDFNIPIVLGSGIDYNNIDMFVDLADIFIIGSHFKKDGHWYNELDKDSIVKFMHKVKLMRCRS